MDPLKGGVDVFSFKILYLFYQDCRQPIFTSSYLHVDGFSYFSLIFSYFFNQNHIFKQTITSILVSNLSLKIEYFTRYQVTDVSYEFLD